MSAVVLMLEADQPDELTKVLAEASRVIAEDRSLLTTRPDGRHTLSVTVTPTYGTPGMEPRADRVSVAFTETGWIYDLSEHHPAGGSGGWAGSCIPAGAVRRFFNAWLEQNSPMARAQLSLFG